MDPKETDDVMSVLHVLVALIALGLLAYLFLALFHPEKFD